MIAALVWVILSGGPNPPGRDEHAEDAEADAG